jgi:hypothetical protein
MKLDEIKPIFIINEIFDTKIPVESWTHNGNESIGALTVDDDEFRIKLEHLFYQVKTLPRKEFINVTFAKSVNGEWSEKLTLDGKGASKILGAIMHAVIDELSNHKYDAIVFAATDNVDRRMHIYNSLAWKIMKRFNDYTVLEDVPFNGGKLTILIPLGCAQNELEAIKAAIQK